MFSSTRGNSFRISKKILCAIMTISLSLMMLPSALFRSEAQAAPTGESSLNLEDNHFGEFVYDTSNSANKVVYDEKTILEKVAALQETDVKIVESASAALKASLIENKYSMMEENLPQAEVGYKVTPTSISSMTSQLACVTPSKVENTDKWQFAISNPSSSLVTGDLLINAALATYKADYLIPFDNNFVPTQEIKYEFDYAGAKGLVKLNASGKTNEKGNVLTLVSLEAQVKSIAKTDIKYGVSVKLGEASANNEPEIAPVNEVNADVEKPAAVLGDDITITSNDFVGFETYVITGFASGTFNSFTPTYNSGVSTITLSSFHWVDSPETLTVNLESATNPVEPVQKTVAVIVSKKAVDVTFDKTFDMRTSEDQKAFVNSASGLKDYQFTFETKSYKLGITNQDSMWSNYVKLWGNPDTGQTTQSLTLNKDAFTVTINGYSASDFSINSISDLTINNPSLVSDSNITMKDGDGKKVDYTEQAFHYNTADKRIKLSVSNSTVATYSETSLSFTSDCTPVPITTTSPEIDIKAYAKANSGNVISKVAIKIGYEPAANLYKYFKVTETTESDINLGVPIIDETFKIFFSHEAVKVSFYFGSVDNINSAYVTVGNKDINLTKDATNKLMYFTVASGDSENIVQNLKDATITTKRILTIQKNTPIKTDQSDDIEKIIAKLQAPTKLAYSWSNGDPQGKYVQENNTLTVIITDPMFEYTKNYYTQPSKGLDKTLFTLNKDGVETSFTYSNFEKSSGDNWTITIPCVVDDKGEAEFTLSQINFITNVLGDKAPEDTTKQMWHFYIDRHDPELTVSWNLNDPINNKYYTAQRVVTLTINDRFFEGTKAMVSGSFVDNNWTSQGDSGYTVEQLWKDEGNNNHVTILRFNYEGDYTISVNGQDKSGRDIKYNGHTGYTSEEFTQDWTAPKLNVSWDNMNAVNGKYYTSGRNVIFTFEERNFNSEYVLFNGQNVTWSQQGQSGAARNVYAFSQSYQSEGDFSIVLNGTDLALHSFDTYSDEFTIDWTKPNIQISGVENRQAYGDSAQPNVTITDANMSGSTTCQVESLGSTKGHPYSASPATSRTQYTYSYANPEKVAENDGVYRINVNAVDMAGNGDVQERVWSVNRFGSTYVIDAETEKIMDGYVNKDSIKDIIVTEINPSGVENHSIDMTKGSFTETLNEGSDYTAAASGGDGTWYECIYTISKNFFKEDGKYTLNYISKDKAGNENENTMANKNADRNAAVNVQFMYDNAKPTVSYDNLSESLYAEANHKATAKFEDNSKKFKEAKVIINGEEKYVSGDDLEKDNGKFEFELKDSGAPYIIETVAIDKAGNEMDKNVKTVVVTMNPFLLWFYNTPLFVGSLVGLGVIVAGVLFFLYRRGLWIFKK